MKQAHNEATDQAAPKEVSSDQDAVVGALQHSLGGPGIDRTRVLKLLSAIRQPTLSPLSRKRDRPCYVCSVGVTWRHSFQSANRSPKSMSPRVPGTTSDTDQNPSSVLKKEDLRLICFEFLS